MVTYGPELARLSELTDRIRAKTARKDEVDEFMNLMYRTGRISEYQWKQYHDGRDVEMVLSTALVVAGLILVAYLLDKALK